MHLDQQNPTVAVVLVACHYAFLNKICLKIQDQLFNPAILYSNEKIDRQPLFLQYHLLKLSNAALGSAGMVLGEAA